MTTGMKRGRGHKQTIDNVLSRVVVDLGPDCWLYTGAQSDRGYGFVKVNQIMTRVHRYVYEQLVGPIPTGLTLDHLCENPICCNPDHLEPVTGAENTRRARRLSHCARGHSMDDAYWSRGKRSCRTCIYDAGRRRRGESE